MNSYLILHETPNPIFNGKIRPYVSSKKSCASIIDNGPDLLKLKTRRISELLKTI